MLGIVHSRVLGVFAGVTTELRAIIGVPPTGANEGVDDRANEFVWLLELPGQVPPSKRHP